MFSDLRRYNSRNSVLAKYVKFCIVGTIGAGIHFSTLYVLTEYFNLWYMISAVIAVGLAMTNNFILNYTWTFRK